MASEIRVTNIKANDGTSSLTVANSTGAVTTGQNLAVGGTLTSTGAITASGGIANAGTITAGTIGGNIVFPSGHILQTVNASLSNMLPTSTVVTTTETILCSADGQITITSGNYVLLHVTAFTYANSGGSNAGVSVSIRRGLTNSGDQLAVLQSGMNGGSNWVYGGLSFSYLDINPGSTTPDYSLSLARFSSGTQSVQNISATLDGNNRSIWHRIILQEIKA